MLVNPRKLVTAVAGTASILFASTIGSWNAPLNQIAGSRAIDLGFSSTALAGTPVQYTPPRRGLPRSTQGTGSRGCSNASDITLSLLVPQDHNGQTVSARPTFFWYISNKTSAPVEFALVEPGVAKPLFIQRMQVQEPGVMKVSIPKESPELATGKKYRWSVSLVCDANRPSSNVFVQSWIERISVNPNLAQKLSALQATANPASLLQEQGRIYAGAGLWYNALEALFNNYTANPNDPSSKADFLSLLEQGGQTQISAAERQRLASQ